MSVGVCVLFLLLEIAGAVVSFKLIRRRKCVGRKYAHIMAAGIISCLLALISGFYLVAVLLLLCGIT
jgi:hypothetical protein